MFDNNKILQAKNILVVGGRGRGKTKFIKLLIKNVLQNNLLIFDYSGDYTQIYKQPFIDYKDFAEKAQNSIKKVIIFEEATIFVNHQKNFSITQLLVRSRHTLNSIILVFHSLRSVPRFVFDLCNYVVLFKTHDIPKFVLSRYEDQEFYELFLKVNKDKDEYAFKVLTKS